jgi:hypothetical protein
MVCDLRLRKQDEFRVSEAVSITIPRNPVLIVVPGR